MSGLANPKYVRSGKRVKSSNKELVSKYNNSKWSGLDTESGVGLESWNKPELEAMVWGTFIVDNKTYIKILTIRGATFVIPWVKHNPIASGTKIYLNLDYFA
jgi:hypothetical protein